MRLPMCLFVSYLARLLDCLRVRERVSVVTVSDCLFGRLPVCVAACLFFDLLV